MNFWNEDKKDKQCRFIFTAAFAHITKGANISGGHCILFIFLRNCFDLFLIIELQV